MRYRRVQARHHENYRQADIAEIAMCLRRDIESLLMCQEVTSPKKLHGLIEDTFNSLLSDLHWLEAQTLVREQIKARNARWEA